MFHEIQLWTVPGEFKHNNGGCRVIRIWDVHWGYILNVSWSMTHQLGQSGVVLKRCDLKKAALGSPPRSPSFCSGWWRSFLYIAQQRGQWRGCCGQIGSRGLWVRHDAMGMGEEHPFAIDFAVCKVAGFQSIHTYYVRWEFPSLECCQCQPMFQVDNIV